MKNTITFVVLLAAALCGAQEKTVILQAGTLLDGRGHVLHHVQIVVQGGRITRIDENGKGTPSYDLSRLTVLPGFIDVHDHITWHFGPNGHIDDPSETPAQATLAAAANAWATLMAGFTTIQSLGSPEDKDLRAAINGGTLPGPVSSQPWSRSKTLSSRLNRSGKQYASSRPAAPT